MQGTAAEGLLAQGTAECQGTAALGGSGHEGEGRMKSVLANPPPPPFCFYRPVTAAEGSLLQIFFFLFAIFSEFWPCWPSCST